MKNPYRCQLRDACPGSRRPTTSESVRRFSIGLDLLRLPWVAGVCTTELTSIPGSKSIRVEGGP
jgi:hypothetical protein